MKRNSLKKGFTLVETLVAVAILSLSILATFTAVSGGLQASTTAKNKIIAFYLAQEGMEYIRNIRDENALKTVSGVSTDWLAGLSASAGDPCYFGKTCRIDSPAKTAVDCGGGSGSCPFLKQDATSLLFGYASGNDTLFKREVQFVSVSAAEVKATINIIWTVAGMAKSFQVTELLFNRQ